MGSVQLEYNMLKTELCSIMEQEGSDKSGDWHNYTEIYYELFEKIRYNNLNIFELGLGTNNTTIPSNMGKDGTPGASLRGWKKFFVNSNIYGADIDKNSLFNEERIKTFYCDQLNKESIKHLFNHELKDIQFDIIIEDGLHEFNANKTFLLNSFEYLKNGGYYIIEDLSYFTSNLFESFRDEICAELNISAFNIVNLPHHINNQDNQILIIKK